MRKKKYYRIVKTVHLCVTRNGGALVDFVPELYTDISYQIEEKKGLFGKWVSIKCNIPTEEMAKTYLQLFKFIPIKTIIK